jgi:hypothetical protein
MLKTYVARNGETVKISEIEMVSETNPPNL